MTRRHTKGVRSPLRFSALVLGAFLVGLGPRTAAQELPANDALGDAILLEEREFDVEGALVRYRAIARDPDVADGVRRHAWLRIGRALLPRSEEQARAALERAAEGDDGVASAAREILAGETAAARRLADLRDGARKALASLRETFFDRNANRRNNTDETLVRTALTSTAGKDLEWIGVPAADVAADALGAELDREDPDGVVVALYAALLWRIGGERAAARLEQALERPERDRRTIALAARIAMSLGSLPDEVMPVARAWVRQGSADVLVQMLAVTSRFAPDVWAPAVERVRDPRLIRSVTAELDVLAQGGRIDEAYERGYRTLVVLHGDDDPRLQRETARPLVVYARGPDPWRSVLEMPEVLDAGSSVPSFVPGDYRALTGPFRRALAASEGKSDRLDKLSAMLRALLSSWTSDSFDGVLAIAEEYARIGEWSGREVDAHGALVWWMPEHATDGQVRRFLEVVAGSWILTTRELVSLADGEDQVPVDWAPPLIRHLSARRSIERDVAALWLLARTGAPAAAGVVDARITPAVLAEVRGSGANPGSAYRLAVGAAAGVLLFGGGGGGRTENLRASLRSVMTEDVTAIPPLVRAGDAAAFEHMDAWTAKDPDQYGVAAPPDGWNVPTRLALPGPLAPLGWRNAADEPFHGYTDDELAAFLIRLIDSGRGDFAVQFTTAMLGPDVETSIQLTSRDGVPARYDPVASALPLCARVLGHYVRTRSRVGNPRLSFGCLLGARITGSVDRAADRVDEFFRAALESPSERVRRVAVGALAVGVDTVELTFDRREATLRALEDPDASVAGTARRIAVQLGIPIDVATFARAAQSDPVGTIDDWAAAVEGDIGPVLTSILAGRNPEAQAAAARALAARPSPAVVPPLLAALTSPDETVRKAARDALESIRFYFDQKRHWDRVFAGTPDLSSARAAAALLDQAGPDEDRPTRLLAIESLGTLGVAEALPFLIRWTRDDDAEIRAAALAAVQAINQRRKD